MCSSTNHRIRERRSELAPSSYFQPEEQTFSARLTNHGFCSLSIPYCQPPGAPTERVHALNGLRAGELCCGDVSFLP